MNNKMDKRVLHILNKEQYKQRTPIWYTKRNELITAIETSLESDITRSGNALDTEVVQVETDEGVIGTGHLHPLAGGLQTLEMCINEMLKPLLIDEKINNIEPEKEILDSKSKLQEILQKRGFGLPSYKIIDHGVSKTELRFEAECRIDDLDISAGGRGTNRKGAEQEAASLILHLYLQHD